MVPVKISQLIVAAGIAAVSFVGVGGSAAAAPPAGETPTCAEGVLTTVTDDNGVQHLACVAVAAATGHSQFDELGGPFSVPDDLFRQ